ncbi:hypothetical protein [Filimonas effusa]|uniref:Uncharacterized protein n=1 Tax=Filimonas effusa TaxID=2508721 RepID=A0A4Q1D557_9BACT|nr:hypothetical protein [Filimonas effusa]RXK83652.1 hypothetical protein ESB13_16350 [Filimonas effusa]
MRQVAYIQNNILFYKNAISTNLTPQNILTMGFDNQVALLKKIAVRIPEESHLNSLLPFKKKKKYP